MQRKINFIAIVANQLKVKDVVQKLKDFIIFKDLNCSSLVTNGLMNLGEALFQKVAFTIAIYLVIEEEEHLVIVVFVFVEVHLEGIVVNNYVLIEVSVIN